MVTTSAQRTSVSQTSIRFEVRSPPPRGRTLIQPQGTNKRGAAQRVVTRRPRDMNKRGHPHVAGQPGGFGRGEGRQSRSRSKIIYFEYLYKTQKTSEAKVATGYCMHARIYLFIRLHRVCVCVCVSLTLTSGHKDAGDASKRGSADRTRRLLPNRGGGPDHLDAVLAQAQVLARKEHLVGVLVHADLAHARHRIPDTARPAPSHRRIGLDRRSSRFRG